MAAKPAAGKWLWQSCPWSFYTSNPVNACVCACTQCKHRFSFHPHIIVLSEALPLPLEGQALCSCAMNSVPVLVFFLSLSENGQPGASCRAWWNACISRQELLCNLEGVQGHVLYFYPGSFCPPSSTWDTLKSCICRSVLPIFQP